MLLLLFCFGGGGGGGGGGGYLVIKGEIWWIFNLFALFIYIVLSYTLLFCALPKTKGSFLYLKK